MHSQIMDTVTMVRGIVGRVRGESCVEVVGERVVSGSQRGLGRGV
jgi:hypothetical protein